MNCTTKDVLTKGTTVKCPEPGPNVTEYCYNMFMSTNETWNSGCTDTTQVAKWKQNTEGMIVSVVQNSAKHETDCKKEIFEKSMDKIIDGIVRHGANYTGSDLENKFICICMGNYKCNGALNDFPSFIERDETSSNSTAMEYYSNYFTTLVPVVFTYFVL